jgi:hypothetical protein
MSVIEASTINVTKPRCVFADRVVTPRSAPIKLNS